MPKGRGICLLPRTQPPSAYAASGLTRSPEALDALGDVASATSLIASPAAKMFSAAFTSLSCSAPHEQRANLQGAFLQHADLFRTNLARVNLARAELIGTEPQQAKLSISQYATLEGHSSFDSIDWQLDDTLRSLLSSGDPSFTRSIEFAPEYKQAVLQILSYFGQIVEQKYPDPNVLVAIKQEGLMVKMTISAPTGEPLEVVKQTLKQYGQVVASALPATALLDSPRHVMQLEHRLEMAPWSFAIRGPFIKPSARRF